MAIGSLCGYARRASCMGPVTSQLTSDSATKLRRRVEITSSTPNRTLRKAGIAPQAIPAIHPAPNTQHTAINGGSPVEWTPTHVAAMAPA